MSIAGWFRTKVFIIAFRLALTKASPGGFTIDETNDFLSVRLIDKVTDKKFLLTGLVKEGAEGLWFNGHNEHGLECVIPMKNLRDFSFLGIHHYSGYNIKWDNALAFVWSYYTLGSWRIEKKDKREQGRFNKRTLARQDRMQVLATFVQQTIKDPDFRASSFALLEILYTRRWFRHPEQETTGAYYDLVLDSLIASGDLKKADNLIYSLQSQGLTTLANYELEERRFRDADTQQRRIGWLTAVLVIVGIVQALATYYAPGSPPVLSPASVTSGR
ncbi:hypothetical protein NKH85_21395 [Mesorhizobium sp. M0924]|uniref:hypothetical protein n=1 Tax=unclassified Mesorhizobium TaxID=325217 RepID=UPI0003D05DDB|nr:MULTISPECIES: hypothetical protein [unclassified Mesorhizobium]ESZ57095.1 hypothetical protein X728_24540 [Mesorhizobium sp. L103C120A0]WJI44601.1 hypothetical protein NL532_29080 [Mesorhizobium sp. C120A]